MTFFIFSLIAIALLLIAGTIGFMLAAFFSSSKSKVAAPSSSCFRFSESFFNVALGGSFGHPGPFSMHI